MKLRSDLALLPLDDDVVVFSEEAQCLFGLNSSAAYVVHELQEGVSSEAIAETLVSEGIAPQAEAAGWVRATVEALQAHGLLIGSSPVPLPTANSQAEDQRCAHLAAVMPPYKTVKASIERRYQLLETCAFARFAMAEQVPWVDAVIGHLVVDENDTQHVTLDILGESSNDGEIISYIYRDGKPVGRAATLKHIGPMVKAALWQSAVNAHDFFFNLHAGVVEKDGECILLPAAAGSGKSSLTAALVFSGFHYCSDEVALIEPSSFRVAPVPLALCCKSTGWDVIAKYFPDVLSLPIHERMDGKFVRYLTSLAGDGATPKRAASVSHIIFPSYDADSPTQLTSVSRIEAIRRLMDECLALRKRLDKENVNDFVNWISQIDCYALSFSSLDEATALIKQVTTANSV